MVGGASGGQRGRPPTTMPLQVVVAHCSQLATTNHTLWLPALTSGHNSRGKRRVGGRGADWLGGDPALTSTCTASLHLQPNEERTHTI